MIRVRQFLAVVLPFAAIIALAAVVVMATIVWTTVLGQRAADRARDARLEIAVRGIEDLLAQENIDREERAERLAEAVDAVDRLQAQRFDELLARVEEILSRPAGSPPDPVTARPAEDPLG